MGNHHTSHDHNSSPTTAKLILEDGELKEFKYPVKVSDLVNKSMNFICKADDLDYDHYISAIDGEEELDIGEIYFLMPLNWLKKPLRAPAMAALAVKASLALNNRAVREKRPAVDFRKGEERDERRWPEREEPEFQPCYGQFLIC